ncbi:hypothetical protein GLAREA_07743 [Glarea lozoyensis ATCC 20868]|uniref:Uncharacterized protein n=1 Tax=Glarea lozoyensis (strain ATCC 20868 / MF5171) TaxID=1116229 RepID=S3D650_GLAL2|nr:uncharacterized protein GLAREA_07743 [Glarea lozoyensis ATCC 20868]EPE32609.1 hypothetical protein GLAREA_07743 [Glarea lozoyensis ATCC 20868]
MPSTGIITSEKNLIILATVHATMAYTHESRLDEKRRYASGDSLRITIRVQV